VTQEAEIRRKAVEIRQGKHFTISYLKKLKTKMAGGAAQGGGPEFKPQHHKKLKLKIRKNVRREEKPQKGI
jgi:hypothetical protein